VLTIGNVNPSGRGMNGRVFDSSGLAPNLTTNKCEGLKIRVVLTLDREEARQKRRRMKESGEPMITLTAQDLHGVEYDQRIRKLTPLDDSFFNRIQSSGTCY